MHRSRAPRSTPEKVWRAYDTIYTGSVVSTEQPAPGFRTHIFERSDLGSAVLTYRLPNGDPDDDIGVRVHFEVARTLKGSPPQDRWHEDLPAMVDCHVGGSCSETVRLYLPGTEIFYLDDFNGLYSPVSGACGVESAQAGTGAGVPGMVFSYYRELYGFRPPLTTRAATRAMSWWSATAERAGPPASCRRLPSASAGSRSAGARWHVACPAPRPITTFRSGRPRR